MRTETFELLRVRARAPGRKEASFNFYGARGIYVPPRACSGIISSSRLILYSVWGNFQSRQIVHKCQTVNNRRVYNYRERENTVFTSYAIKILKSTRSILNIIRNRESSLAGGSFMTFRNSLKSWSKRVYKSSGRERGDDVESGL